MLIIRVKHMLSPTGNKVANQFVIETTKGTYFQSYESIIAFISNTGGSRVTLDKDYWDYSRTTGKYRNIFLGEDKKATEAKIASGEYKLADLNK